MSTREGMTPLKMEQVWRRWLAAKLATPPDPPTMKASSWPLLQELPHAA